MKFTNDARLGGLSILIARERVVASCRSNISPTNGRFVEAWTAWHLPFPGNQTFRSEPIYDTYRQLLRAALSSLAPSETLYASYNLTGKASTIQTLKMFFSTTLATMSLKPTPLGSQTPNKRQPPDAGYEH